MKALKALSYWQASWLPWFPVTGGGWTIGLIIGLGVAESANQVFPMEVSLAIAGVVAGAFLGLAQRFALHLDARGIGSSMLASGLGWAVGLAITVLVVVATNSLIGAFIGALLGSLAFGVAQWLALNPDAKNKKDWLFFTIVGWTASMTLGIALESVSPSTSIAAIVQTAQAGAVGLVIIGLLAIFAMFLTFPTYGGRDITTYVRWLP
jgi:hypothetical protein